MTVEKILDFIKQFEAEESRSQKWAYPDYDITKDNKKLLQKLRRKFKSEFSK